MAITSRGFSGRRTPSEDKKLGGEGAVTVRAVQGRQAAPLRRVVIDRKSRRYAWLLRKFR